MTKTKKMIVAVIILLLSYITYNIYIEYQRNKLYEQIINIYIEQINKAIENYENN